MSKKLLIVDDKKEIRHLVRTTFELEGWEVCEAAGGDEGVEIAAKCRPDLVIMDMVMPGKVDGLEATRRIKADPETAGCRVIMLSGARMDLRDAAIEAGVAEFIEKPFSPLDLINRIERLFY